MASRRWVAGIGGIALLALAIGPLGCGESCEDFATKKCAPDFDNAAGDGSKYDSCYLQALAECGHSS